MSKKIQYKLIVKSNYDKSMKLKQFKDFTEIKNVSSQKNKKGIISILFYTKQSLSNELVEYLNKLRENYVLETTST